MNILKKILNILINQESKTRKKLTEYEYEFDEQDEFQELLELENELGLNIPNTEESMNPIKKQIIDNIIKVEGGYVNHKSDKGGQTNYGITETVQRQNGFNGDMKDLPRELAFEIYSKRYWDVNKLDDIVNISEKVQEEIQDTGVNMGVQVQARFLQRALNQLNDKDEYPELVNDGILGPKSIEALKMYFNRRGKDQELVLLRILNSLQGARYVEISESRKANKDFIFGWFKHRVQI